ncbi:hypothetical protein JS533_011930 [Bifidobacterium amazonense]|uniref:Uncharacterized protein n=1 Tax=Bifidobacterium amazonense TaxID=2809027 RepID=A0ABS9VYT2_9BIFI|nr:hypothetical protein [Bifidobacterium amazonense]MCH9276965.1 hypothetical protein [Bifidobacterium amazonense]
MAQVEPSNVDKRYFPGVLWITWHYRKRENFHHEMRFPGFLALASAQCKKSGMSRLVPGIICGAIAVFVGVGSLLSR